MWKKTKAYLDFNAGAPLQKKVKEGLNVFFNQGDFLLSNPSSIHAQGRYSKRVITDAREKIALSLGEKIDLQQFSFTSSGTEANQWVIRSTLEKQIRKGIKPHWITTPVEHDSTLQMIDWLTAKGGSISFLPISSDGVVQVDAFEHLFRPETALVSVIWVNNETGIITDINALSNLTKQHALPLHVDGAQAWGKIPFNLNLLGAQFVTFSAHKIGAFSGLGFVWFEKGSLLLPLLLGKQDRGLRGGTENTLGIMSAGIAASEIDPVLESKKVCLLRDRLENEILIRIPRASINGSKAPRVGNTLNVYFEDISAEALVIALDLEGYCVSTGSACSSGTVEPSHVLIAMGRSKSEAMGSIRISFSSEITWGILEDFLKTLEKVILRMRNKHESFK